MLPVGSGDYYSWPLVIDIFPWQHSGVQFKRKWPIGSTPTVLESRWHTLLNAPAQARPELLAETEAKASGSYRSIEEPNDRLRPLTDLDRDQRLESPVRYGYRSFDRQWAIPDARLCDRPRPPLWSVQSPEQVYFASFLTGIPGTGPLAVVSAEIPDLDYFRGSYGGKHIIPIWRDRETTQANITLGLLERLNDGTKMEITPPELFAYFYCVLATTAYTDKFSEELAIPGPRLPVAKNQALFRRVADIGSALIWLHTFGQRFEPRSGFHHMKLQGNARCSIGVSTDPAQYPDTFAYDEMTRTLRVGNGEFAPVQPEVWKFEVSGLVVIESWLRYRMKSGYGRRSSKLDEIRPEHWTAQLTEELLQIVWILEESVAIQPELTNLLDQIVSGPCFTADELPRPSDAERRAPLPDEEEDTAPLQLEIT